MKVVILCGGMGTRLRGAAGRLPKPLVLVGRHPILWHVMRGYAAFGFKEFILCLGFGGSHIRDYFQRERDGVPPDWRIEFADTGLYTNTGGRIKRIEPRIQGDTFFATYADGVANIDPRRLLEFHRRHSRIGTITTVNPASPFGELTLGPRGIVTGFVEKPLLQRWINGGFFVFSRPFFRYLQANSILERDPLASLARDRQLVAFKHTGFWCCMDTYKDTLTLNDLCREGPPPWTRWAER